ncbi:MAG: stage II sporulation protein P [Clostridia bacterium]|nr:stage II sporulation protein P [Clostridia bacterium]
MNNRGAIIRFGATVLSAVLFLTYTSFLGLSAAQGDTIATTDTAAVSLDTTVQNEQIENAEKTENTSKDSSEQKTPEPKVVAAASGGTVCGKVIEKFISPYTANTSYNNVYLKNGTDLDINLKEFLDGKLGYTIDKNDQPQVLIMHTHATESFLLTDKNTYTDQDATRTTDNEYNMVALGKIVSDKLNAAGIKTLHDTTQHDYPSYNQSYSRAAKTISSYTQKHQSIKVVIDLHRDAVAANDTDKVKLTTEINGKKAAQIMLVMGAQTGNVTNFPNWRENLKLATKIQQTVEVMYPSLARSIRFVPKNYNQSLSNGAVLIEIGTDGNSIDEVKYSAELLGNALVNLFNTL